MYPQEKVSEKCPCIHGTEDQDWHMNSRNGYPLIKPFAGLGAPEFDAPNLRRPIFSGPMQTHVFPTNLPGRPYAPSGAASLDPSRRPIGPDSPKYGADTTGGSNWSLHSFLSPASPDPRGAGDDPLIPSSFGIAALLIALTPLLIGAGILYIIYVYMNR